MSLSRWIYTSVYLALFGVSLYYSIPIWFPFLLLAGYSAYMALRRNTADRSAVGPVPEMIKYGELGRYPVDGDERDLSYGLYTQIAGQSVFIDIREDKLIEQRNQYAAYLHMNRGALDQSLSSFTTRRPEFRFRKLNSIGLHSSVALEGEVFWDPEGHTSLKGLEFLD